MTTRRMRETATALELLQDLKRSHWLPPFSVRSALLPLLVRRVWHSCEGSAWPTATLPPSSLPQAEGVRNVVETMSEMYEDSKALQRLEGIDMRNPEDSAAPMVRVLTMLRNRDMLLGYLRHRMERIEAARWDLAGQLPEEAVEMLSPNERAYELEYAELLGNFQAEYDIDLTLHAKPPTDLYIKVLVREDVGEIIGPESGATIALRKGDTVFLRRGDVEPLIRQGKLQHID